jgi:hypothetical protein
MASNVVLSAGVISALLFRNTGKRTEWNFNEWWSAGRTGHFVVGNPFLFEKTLNEW